MPTVDHSKNLIELKDVTFAYDSEVILSNINLEIHQGDYIGLVGPNGAGKTTLIKIILGLLKPKSGSVTLFGKDIAGFKEWSKIGYIPQKATHFDAHFPATVEEVVMMGQYQRQRRLRFTNSHDQQLVEQALETVGMTNCKKRLIGDLSGGQQQRVFMALALVSQPEIIFLDEPTTGVDKATREDFYHFMRTLNRDADLTLVLVSHDLDLILKEVMHIACLDRSLVYHRSPEDFLKASDRVCCTPILSHHHH